MNKNILTILQKTALYTIGTVAGVALVALFCVALLTPDKTPSGQYTDPILYWTSPEYYQQEFINAAKPDYHTHGCATDWECEQCGEYCENPED